ncbi:hypothetical protein K504DRAFT_529528 [Pleomassaria siparia CBS 279.74]|uniref:Uncharacterized protein n=1 Tax=Pleomassaria siparia CBS 279.74 TaxID=1314801 RepID=A0A6G1KSN7_9PLEO|nr:hypothetical protein K504DRAFT_529528 [Pleomassaria siparia CBS 279.74]
MAGSFQSTWLSNLSLKDKAKDTIQNYGPHPTASITTPSEEIEVDYQGEDEGLWYDCSSSEDTSSSVQIQSANTHTLSSHVTVKAMTPKEEAELLPYIPSVFGTELPPCNAEVQIAYENVVKTLRSRWLHHRGRVAAIDICYAVKEELANQNFLYPAFTLKGKNKKRKPWRREYVFKYELRWIEYFVTEAAAQTPELMTESELMERKKEASAPGVLGFNLGDRADVRKLWDEWNVRRRVKLSPVPGTEKALAAGMVHGQETNHHVEENLSHTSETDIDDMTQSKPATERKGGDDHHWSHGVKWDGDKDAILLMGIFEHCDLKIGTAICTALAKKIGEGCTAKAVSHRLNNLKSRGKPTVNGSPSTPRSAFKKTPTSSVRGRKSTGKSGKNAFEDQEDDDEDLLQSPCPSPTPGKKRGRATSKVKMLDADSGDELGGPVKKVKVEKTEDSDDDFGGVVARGMHGGRMARNTPHLQYEDEDEYEEEDGAYA